MCSPPSAPRPRSPTCPTTRRCARGPVGVIGAGTMGGGITMNFLNAGIPVVLLEMKQEALDKGLATIRRNYENTRRRAS
jgi:3-hydroxyacyl-CoA dehydrogenase